MTAAVDEKVDAPVATPVMVTVEEPDPLWDMRVGGDRMKGRDRDIFFQGAESGHDDDDWPKCNEMVTLPNGEAENVVGDHGRWRCTRPPHPDHWRHIATSGYRGDIRAYAMWGGTDPAMLATEPVVPDPDPGKFELVEGNLYKLRNRPTVLLLLGKRRGKRVELLDLTHQRYRVLPMEDLVPRPADAEPVTQEQMEWVAKYMAERRAKTRQTAIDQRNEGRFRNKSEVDEILRELNLEPTRVVTKGYVNIQFNVEGKDSASIKKAVKDWAKKLGPIPGVVMTRELTEGDMGWHLNQMEG